MPGPDVPALVALLMVLVPGGLVLAFAAPSARLVLWEAALVGVAWLGLKVRGVGWAAVGLRSPPGWAEAVLLGLGGAGLLLAGSLLLRAVVERALGWTVDVSAFRILEGNPRALAGGLAVVWTLAAFGEELLYRGFLLDTIHVLLPGPGGTGGVSWWIALALSSLLFGLAHAFQGRAAVVISGAVGMGYGALVLLGGDTLWPAIVAHGVYDTVAFVLVFAGLHPAVGPRKDGEAGAG